MDAPPVVNPFVPGHGHVPPCLAGRAPEQRELNGLLAYLKAGRGAPRNAILSGPRGNGKTALLRWFLGVIEACEPKIDAVWLTPNEVPSLDALANALVPPRRFSSLRPDTLSVALGLGRLGWELGDRPGSLTALLTARCKRRPLVLLLDEAHTLEEGVGRALLNAGQSASAESPLLMALAGTPGLHTHLNTLSATFWSRGRKLGIGLLDEAAAAEALATPLADRRPAAAFDEDHLRHVVSDSQCYPYFVQLWGAALWDALEDDHATAIDAAIVRRAQARFDEERSAYYEDRRDELKRMGLLGLAADIATAYGDRPFLTEADVDRAIAASLAADAPMHDLYAARDGLATIGYLWKRPGLDDRWQPGIPSLMTYVAAHA